MKAYIKSIIELNDNKPSRVFGFLIQVFIIISIFTFSAETTPDLDPQARKVLDYIELFCVILFSIEYVLRIYVADKKFKFIFSFFGIIDLLAILPFYLSFGVDLRSIRAFRFIRLFRLFKLVRYNRAIKHFARAISIAREEILLFFFITIILIYISGVGIYYFEHEVNPKHFSSIFDSLWWAIITITTVGYGDAVPATTGGRIFTFIVLMIGLAVVAIPTGILSSALMRSIEEKEK